MNAEKALAVVRGRIAGASARVGLILGSGLGHLADLVEGEAIDYGDLPGFPHAGSIPLKAFARVVPAHGRSHPQAS